MKNKRNIIFNILKYGLLLLLFFYSLVISYNMFFGDTVYNFGFSYAISRGEIPYNDFNLIVPIFSPLFYSISLMFTKNVLAFFVMQSILLVILFYILEKILVEKVYILLAFIFLGYPICLFSAFFPGYNFIILFLIILLIYLEKRKSNDYLIGFIIGLSIITKHTLGVFLIFPSLIYLKSNRKKIVKRCLGLLGPCLLFLIYLLVNKSFYNFFNLCILGLFDFAKSNIFLKNFKILSFLVIAFLYLMYNIFKRKKDINNYYTLCSLLLAFPIIDDYHISFFIILVLIIFLNNCNFKINKNILVGEGIIFILLFNIIWTINVFNYNGYKFFKFSNYPLRYLNQDDYETYCDLNNFIKKSDKNIVLFISESYFYKITNNLDINYFDLSNYGNYGYNSYEMMKAQFNDLEDSLIFINSEAISNKKIHYQYYRELALYVVKNYQYVCDVSKYKVYYKK